MQENPWVSWVETSLTFIFHSFIFCEHGSCSISLRRLFENLPLIEFAPLLVGTSPAEVLFHQVLRLWFSRI